MKKYFIFVSALLLLSDVTAKPRDYYSDEETESDDEPSGVRVSCGVLGSRDHCSKTFLIAMPCCTCLSPQIVDYDGNNL